MSLRNRFSACRHPPGGKSGVKASQRGGKTFWGWEKVFSPWHCSILSGKRPLPPPKESLGRGIGQSSRGKDLLAREKAFSPWHCSILSRKRPFAWPRKSFRRSIDPLPQKKDLFLVPPPQSWSRKVFGAGRKVFEPRSAVKRGLKSSFVAPTVPRLAPWTLSRAAMAANAAAARPVFTAAAQDSSQTRRGVDQHP